MSISQGLYLVVLLNSFSSHDILACLSYSSLKNWKKKLRSVVSDQETVQEEEQSLPKGTLWKLALKLGSRAFKCFQYDSSTVTV